jgi:hypothetical protein
VNVDGDGLVDAPDELDLLTLEDAEGALTIPYVPVGDAELEARGLLVGDRGVGGVSRAAAQHCADQYGTKRKTGGAGSTQCCHGCSPRLG